MSAQSLAPDQACWRCVQDLLRLAKAFEPLHLMWLEDAITGDYTPFVNADVYRDVTMQTTPQQWING